MRSAMIIMTHHDTKTLCCTVHASYTYLYVAVLKSTSGDEKVHWKSGNHNFFYWTILWRT